MTVHSHIRIAAIIALSIAGPCLAQTAASFGSGHDSGDRATSYDLPSQPLADALKAIGAQGNVNVLISPDLVDGRTAPALRASLTFNEAIAELLRGTGLTFRYLSDKTIVLAPEGSKTSAAASGLSYTPSSDRSGTIGLAQADESAAGSASTHGSPAASGATEQSGIEEIVVTAQKRQELLKDVPISISVLSGETLESGPVSSLRDALRTVPGVVGYENFQAGGMTKFSVRGVASNSSLFNGAPVVGFYLDETPISFARFPVTPDVNAYDLERVEVLRGPQGTLYGASSLNGVVRVITKSANLDDFELTARGTGSSTADGGNNGRADVAINIPLVPGKLALRATAGYSEYSGWVDSPSTNEKDINDSRDKNYRVRLRAVPIENLDIQLSAWGRRGDGGGYATSYKDRTLGTRGIDPNAPTGEPSEAAFDSQNLTMNYAFPSFSLMSSTSNLRYTNDAIYGVAPSLGEQLLTRLESEAVSQEFRAASTSDGPWKWSLGALYRDAEDVQYQDFLKNALGASLSGVSLAHYTTESYAVYGELTRRLFDKRLELTAGWRYFHDQASADEMSGFDPTRPVSGLNSNTFKASTPRLVVTYLPNDDFTVYASYSQGFRSGFTLTGTAQLLAPELSANVRPDRLFNYEIGSKGRTSNRIFSYDFALYYMDWQDTVQVVNRQIPGTLTGAFAAFNAESASGLGADLAVTVAPSDRVQFGGTVSWNDLTFDQDVLSAGALFYPKGSRLNESPEWTASAFFDYRVPFAAGYSATFSGSVNYSSSLSFNPIPTMTFGDNLLTARTSFALRAPGNWEYTLFVDNLTDEDGAIRFGAFIPNAGDRFRPRTIGVQVNFAF